MRLTELTVFIGFLLSMCGCEKKAATKPPEPHPNGAENTSQPSPNSGGPSEAYFDYKNPPSALISELKRSRIVYLQDAPKGWFSEKDVKELMGLIRSAEPSGSTISLYSSSIPNDPRSTIGREALFLIEGYRNHRFPPSLSSEELSLTAEEAEDWYRQRSQNPAPK